MSFKVANAKCSECLFSKNKIVSNERRAEVLKDCRRGDRYFVCHQSSMKGGEVCCKGFYDANPYATNLMRIASRLGAVLFVDVALEPEIERDDEEE